MAVLPLVLFIFAMTATYSDATNWCVCRSDQSEQALQKALDFACGNGADCSPVLQSGSCFQPNTVRAHCSFAVNSYYQKKGQGVGTCVFDGAATVTGTDPSSNGCSYPTGSSGSSTTTPSTGGTGTGTGTIAPPTGTGTGTGTSTGTGTGTGTGTSTGTGTGTGTGFTPSSPSGMYGSGLGPSGTGITQDPNDGGHLVLGRSTTTTLVLLSTLWCSGLVFWWG